MRENNAINFAKMVVLTKNDFFFMIVGMDTTGLRPLNHVSRSPISSSKSKFSIETTSQRKFHQSLKSLSL